MYAGERRSLELVEEGGRQRLYILIFVFSFFSFFYASYPLRRGCLPQMEKAAQLLAKTLKPLKDFNGKPSSVVDVFARTVATNLYAKSEDKDSFRDSMLALITNLPNLEGELYDGETQLLSPEKLACMDADELRSQQQKKEVGAERRKRMKTEINFDKTSMTCAVCGLVRQDRLNINQMGLDSEENGTQFDYNFGNLCECSSHHSSSDSSDDEASSSEEST